MQNPVILLLKSAENQRMVEMMARLIPAANDDSGGDNQRVYAQCRFYWPSPVY